MRYLTSMTGVLCAIFLCGSLAIWQVDRAERAARESAAADASGSRVDCASKVDMICQGDTSDETDAVVAPSSEK